jgi:hypothetical protein
VGRKLEKVRRTIRKSKVENWEIDHVREKIREKSFLDLGGRRRLASRLGELEARVAETQKAQGEEIQLLKSCTPSEIKEFLEKTEAEIQIEARALIHLEEEAQRKIAKAAADRDRQALECAGKKANTGNPTQ